MKQVTLKIPGMQSTHCQQNVKKAIAIHAGVTINEQSAGQLSLGLPDNLSEQDLVRTIERTGYKVAMVSPTSGSASSPTTFTYKTNIHCAGCLAKIGPHLEALEGIHQWEVDTHNPDKTLKVTAEGVTSEKIMTTVQNAGFQINSLNNKS